MTLTETTLPGVFTIALEPRRDERGDFARVFCAETFAARGLPAAFPQTSYSTNKLAGTLRGLHYQAPPHAEGKLVRCSRGAIFDVAVDLRRGSPSFGRAFTVELAAEKPLAVYLPPGCAHGFLSLRDDTEVVYQISVPYQPAAATGIRWDDPTLAIRWPFPPRILSDRDRTLPSWSEVFS